MDGKVDEYKYKDNKEILRIFRFLFKLPNRKSMETMILASIEGFLPVIKALYNIGMEPTLGMIEYASKYGHLSIVEYLYDKVMISNSSEYTNSMDLACEYGRVNIVNFFHSKGIIPSEGIKYACRYGHIEVIKVFQYIKKNMNIALEEASKYNNTDIVNFVYPYCDESSIENAIFLASHYDNLEIAEFLWNIV